MFPAVVIVLATKLQMMLQKFCWMTTATKWQRRWVDVMSSHMPHLPHLHTHHPPSTLMQHNLLHQGTQLATLKGCIQQLTLILIFSEKQKYFVFLR